MNSNKNKNEHGTTNEKTNKIKVKWNNNKVK